MATSGSNENSDWNESLCFWCGTADATGRDHVVPKSWFEQPRPSNLPTVPSCGTCNRGFQRDEELLLVYLVGAEGSNDAAQRLYSGPVLRGLKRDRAERFRHRVLGSIRRGMAQSPGGLLYPADFVIPEAGRVGRVLDKITRGLYYTEYGERLNKAVVVRITDEPLSRADNTWRSLTGKQLGEVLVYRFGRVAEQPTRSLWYLMFFGCSLYRVFTDSEDLMDFVRLFRP